MATPVIGEIVVVPFPFADLSGSKKRPAAVVAEADHGDVILCQITSRPWASASAIRIDEADVQGEGLQRTSYARPDKLFTASPSVTIRSLGVLNAATLAQLRAATASLFT